MQTPEQRIAETETAGADLSDLSWALERVTRLCASALVDAQFYRQKLMKGFGYPDEVFRCAQDYRALATVLAALAAERAAREKSEQDLAEWRKHGGLLQLLAYKTHAEGLEAKGAALADALRALVDKWLDAAVWEHDDMSNVQSAQTFDQCANELAAILEAKTDPPCVT